MPHPPCRSGHEDHLRTQLGPQLSAQAVGDELMLFLRARHQRQLALADLRPGQRLRLVESLTELTKMPVDALLRHPATVREETVMPCEM